MPSCIIHVNFVKYASTHTNICMYTHMHQSGGEDYLFILALQYFMLYTHMYQGGE